MYILQQWNTMKSSFLNILNKPKMWDIWLYKACCNITEAGVACCNITEAGVAWFKAASNKGWQKFVWLLLVLNCFLKLKKNTNNELFLDVIFFFIPVMKYC